MSGTSGQPFGGQYNLSNLTAPASGTTHAAKFQIVFASATTVQINMQGYMEFLGDFQGQSMMVDNTGSSAPLTITEFRYGWKRIVPAGAVQTFQYPAVDNQIFNITAGAASTVTLSVFDWPAFPDAGAVIGGGTVVVAQPIATFILPTLANGGASHSIVTGGVAQPAIAAFAIQQQGMIRNPNGASESLFVDIVNTAGLTDGAGGTTVELKAGDKYIIPPIQNAVSVNAVTSAHAFIVVVV